MSATSGSSSFSRARAVAGVMFALAATPCIAPAQSALGGYISLDSLPRRAGAAGTGLTESVVTLAMADARRSDVVRAIGTQSGLGIVFDPALPGMDGRITVRYAQVPAATAIMRALSGSGAHAMLSPTGTQVVLVGRPRDERRAGRLTGSVRTSQGPVAAARVELLGTPHRATTHDDGTFTVSGVPAGEYRVRVTRIGYSPLLRDTLRVERDGDTRVELQLLNEAVPLQAVVVTPGFHGLLDASANAAQGLSREQLETVPQIGEDIYRAINRLPGVAAADFSARFSVRGATADQLYVTLDGLRLIEPFHLKDIGSALSIIDIQTLGDASLVSGGASAAYGDQTGGVFEMRSMDPRVERPRSSVGISLTNVRASSQGAFGAGRGGWLVSGRRGFLDLAFKVSRMGDSISPRYDDVFAKVQYALGGGGEIALHALHSGDDLTYRDQGEEHVDSRYLADYLWLTLSQPMGTRWRSESVLSAGALDWKRGGQSSVDVSPQAVVHDRRTLESFELRQDLSVQLSPGSLLSVGADLRHERADYEYGSVLTQLAVGPTGLTPVTRPLATAVRPGGNTVGLYLSHRARPLEAVTIETGVRLDRGETTGERLVSPRLGAAWEVRDGTMLRASWGRYMQAQPLFALSAQDGERDFSPADRSEQEELALEQRLPWHMTLRVDAYQRLLSYQRPRFVNAFSATVIFPEITPDRVTIPATTGSARGVEMSLARAVGGMEWSANYALARATDDIGGRDVPRATDQLHTLHADWSYHPASNAWRLAVGGVWHSGTPDTPQLVHIDTLVDSPTRFSLYSSWTPGPLYSERVPAYHRVDVRWTRYFATRTGRISLFGELFNAFSHDNVRGYYTNVDVRGRTVSLVRLPRTQLPMIPSAGFTWEF